MGTSSKDMFPRWFDCNMQKDESCFKPHLLQLSIGHTPVCDSEKLLLLSSLHAGKHLAEGNLQSTLLVTGMPKMLSQKDVLHCNFMP